MGHAQQDLLGATELARAEHAVGRHIRAGGDDCAEPPQDAWYMAGSSPAWSAPTLLRFLLTKVLDLLSEVDHVPPELTMREP